MVPGTSAKSPIHLLMIDNFVAAVRRKQAILGEFSWILVGQAASVLGAIVGVRLLTDAIPPQVYGELALAMTAATLVNQIILGPLSNAYFRFYAPAEEAGELGSYLSSVARLTVWGGLAVISVAFAAILAFASLGYATWVSLLAATMVFAMVSGCNSIMDGIQNAARHRSVVALHQGIASWLRFLCAVWLVSAFGIKSTIAMWGYCLGSLVVIASQALFFERGIVHSAHKKEWPPASDTKPWRNRMFSYAWPFSLWGVVTWLQLSSDRWALQVFGNTEDVGLYAVVYQLGFYPLMLLSGVVSQLVAPLFFQLAGDGTDEGRKALVSRRNRLMTIAALCIAACCVAAAAGLHTWVFRFLVAEEYRSVSWLLPAVALSGGLFGTAQLGVLGLLSCHNSRILLKPKLCTALVGIVLDFWGAFVWGLAGVVTAGIMANGVYLLWVIRLNATSRPKSGHPIIHPEIELVSNVPRS
jgi:O-antigen/teichoic acid export membrane protein